MVAFALMMLVFPMGNMLGAPPPSVYRKAKNIASEQLIIRVGDVVSYPLRNNMIYVRARAKVLRVERSRHHVHSGSWITIRYRYARPGRKGKFRGADPMTLKKGSVYRAYLNRSSRRWFYEPAAGFQSFQEIHYRRIKHAHTRRSIRF